MATETARVSVGSSTVATTVTLSNYYSSITVENLAASGLVWVRADGTAAVSEADGCFPLNAGQTITLNNGLAYWSQVYSVLAKGTLSGGTPGTPAEVQPYGSSLAGGESNPGVSVSAILDTGSSAILIEVASAD
jgi:hypothetical protein